MSRPRGRHGKCAGEAAAVGDDSCLLVGCPPERWIVVAFKSGRWVQMFPRHRAWFPVCGSRQEARERAEMVKATNPQFAARWAGWMFTQVPLDGVVEY
jgi:hypothetical protein